MLEMNAIYRILQSFRYCIFVVSFKDYIKLIDQWNLVSFRWTTSALNLRCVRLSILEYYKE